jgi:hypothetical protein
MEAPQSLLRSHTVGNGLLTLEQSGKAVWSVCSIEVRTGQVRWCSPLPRRSDTALSVVADKAVVHDHDGYLFAYDLGTGRALWNAHLDCAISEGSLRAVRPGLAVAACAHGESVTIDSPQVDLLAIELETGQLAWRKPPAPQFSQFYLDGEQIVVMTPVPLSRLGLPDLSQPIAQPAKKPRKSPKTLHPARVPSPQERSHSLVGSAKSEWSVIDARTGEVLPHAVLIGALRISVDAGVLGSYRPASTHAGRMARASS